MRHAAARLASPPVHAWGDRRRGARYSADKSTHADLGTDVILKRANRDYAKDLCAPAGRGAASTRAAFRA